MAAALSSSAGCFLDPSREVTDRRAEELAPEPELGPRSPLLTWECGKIPGTRRPCTPGHLPYHVGDYVPHT